MKSNKTNKQIEKWIMSRERSSRNYIIMVHNDLIQTVIDMIVKFNPEASWEQDNTFLKHETFDPNSESGHGYKFKGWGIVKENGKYNIVSLFDLQAARKKVKGYFLDTLKGTYKRC